MNYRLCKNFVNAMENVECLAGVSYRLIGFLSSDGRIPCYDVNVTICPKREYKPIRVQRSRARGWRMPANTIYVGRPTRWGNPFTGPDAVTQFRAWLDGQPELVERARRELGGHNLACWCALGQPCHADVYLEVANNGNPVDADMGGS